VSKETNFKRHGSRYKARRRAVDILFEAEFRDIDPVDIVAERVSLSKDAENQVKPVPEYTRQIVEGVAVHLDALDESIASHLFSEWRLDRLPAVDRAVLRVSAWEVMFNDDVPGKVAMKEGVELASEYSHDKAPGYVNVVLDGVGRDADIRLADAAAAQRESQEAAGSGDPSDVELESLIGNVVGEESTSESAESSPEQPESASDQNDSTPNQPSSGEEQ